MEFVCPGLSGLTAHEVKENYSEKEVRPRGGRRRCGRVREGWGSFVLKFFRQPTEKTLDGAMPGRSPRQPTKRRTKEMLKKLMGKMQNEEGQGLVEYALIIVLVSIACIVALSILGVSVSNVFSQITTSI